MPDNPMPVSKSRLLANVFPKPAKVAAGLLVVALDPELLGGVLGELGILGVPEPPELPELEPLEELFPPAASTDGVMFSGAFFASAANVSWVRDWFIAGLVRMLALTAPSTTRCKHTD